MSDRGAAAAVTVGGVAGVAGVADFVSGGGLADVVSSGVGVTDVIGGGGAGVADVASSGVGETDVVGGGVGGSILGFFGDVGGLISAAFFTALGYLGDVAIGVVVGGGIVVAVGFLLLAFFAVVTEFGARRGEQQIPRTPTMATQLHAIQSLAPTPRTLRWVRGLLPSDEGAAWLAEVTSCLAESCDEGERRRHIRGYRRAVPRLVWTSWVLHLRGSRSRTLS
jgi:hypothetical protein